MSGSDSDFVWVAHVWTELKEKMANYSREGFSFASRYFFLAQCSIEPPGGGNSHIKVMGVIVGNFEKNP